MSRSRVFSGNAEGGEAATPRELQKGLYQRNLGILDRVRKSDGGELTKLRRGETLKEVDRGWVTPPVAVSEAMSRTTPPPKIRHMGGACGSYPLNTSNR